MRQRNRGSLARSLGVLFLFTLVIPNAAGATQAGTSPAEGDACTPVLGRNSMKPVYYDTNSGRRKHRMVCVQLQLQDTSRHPVVHGPIAVMARVFYRPNYKLNHVDPFKPVPQQPGLYVGILPIDDDDELDLFSLVFSIEGFLPVTLNPRRFSGSEPFPRLMKVVLPRNVDDWRPKFDYSAVPDGLNHLLSKSLFFLDVYGRAHKIADFDGKLGRNSLDDKSYEFVLGKAAALNLYYVLNRISGADGTSNCMGGAPNWLSMINEIVAIGQERIIAKVQPNMFAEVEERIDNLQDPYSCVRDRSANSSLHQKNFAGYYSAISAGATGHAVPVETISLKSPECRGNLQITVGKYKLADDITEVLADIDFDEDFAFLAHMTDVIQHAVTGKGTNPILVHEYLKALDHEAVLAYDVVPAIRRSSRPPHFTERPAKKSSGSNPSRKQ